MKLLNISLISLLLVIAVLESCSKPAPGYLSKVLVYNPKTLNATKGRVTTSGALIVDGSTSPINVKLLGIRNFYTKQKADSILLKKFEIPIYKGEITQNDTTLAQLAPKLGTALYPVFNVNSIGGRIEISPASTFVDTGTYEFDINVTNPAGTRDVPSAGIVRLVNAANPFDITRQAVTTTPANAETPSSNQSNYTLTITRTAGPNRIILRFLDKNGVAFNPATQLLGFVDRPQLRNFAPYYPEVKTDSSLIYQYPEKLPTFPLFQYTSINPDNGAVVNRQWTSFYRIRHTATDLNVNVNTEIGFRLWPVPGEASVSGTYTITMKLNFVARKP
jgi:hypothetical protein